MATLKSHYFFHAKIWVSNGVYGPVVSKLVITWHSISSVLANYSGMCPEGKSYRNLPVVVIDSWLRKQS